jgi:hemerythrin-like domain-containing protein
MRLLDELRREHDLIERVIGSLRTYVGKRADGGGDLRDGEGFVRFFRNFSGGYHHVREEEILFPALQKHLELPPRSGPLYSLLDQHRKMAATLDEMAPLLLGDLSSPESDASLAEVATKYGRDLLLHIDAENSVLLPESETRLRGAGVHELDDRPATPAELAARGEGERLVALYPPSDDPGAIRGEGCVICPSYGTTCGGLEHEWWNDSEWERFGRGRE